VTAEQLVPSLKLDEWFDHPLVREAQRGLKDDSSPIDLFVNLYGVLTELDERFPGIPYRTVLAAPTASGLDKNALALQMREAGVSDDDIQLVTAQCGLDGELDESLFPMVRDRQPLGAWLDHGVSTGAARNFMRLHRPLTAKEQRAWELIKEGYTIGEIHRTTGLGRPTIRSAKRKIQYQLWLAAQRAVSVGLAGLQGSSIYQASVAVSSFVAVGVHP